MSNTRFDYEALWRTLDSLGHLRVPPENVRASGPDLIAGGYGDVQSGWLAVPDAGGMRMWKNVALKTIRPVGTNDDKARVAFRFAREINVWANLRHPNVLPLLGFFLSDDMTVAQLISPFEVNGHIGEYLKRTQPSEAKRIDLAIDAAQGLSYLHGCDPPVCHGDLKAQNVLVNGDTRAVLCDFGLAKVMENGATGLTTTVTFQGSMRYLSPELFEDQPRRTLKSDIWAYACLLLEILLDLVPYNDVQGKLGIVRKHAQGIPPAALDTLPFNNDCRILLEQCFRVDPESRPDILRCSKVLEDQVPLRTGVIRVSFGSNDRSAWYISQEEGKAVWPPCRTRICALTPNERNALRVQFKPSRKPHAIWLRNSESERVWLGARSHSGVYGGALLTVTSESAPGDSLSPLRSLDGHTFSPLWVISDGHTMNAMRGDGPNEFAEMLVDHYKSTAPNRALEVNLYKNPQGSNHPDKRRVRLVFVPEDKLSKEAKSPP